MLDCAYLPTLNSYRHTLGIRTESSSSPYALFTIDQCPATVALPSNDLVTSATTSIEACSFRRMIKAAVQRSLHIPIYVVSLPTACSNVQYTPTVVCSISVDRTFPSITLHRSSNVHLSCRASQRVAIFDQAPYFHRSYSLHRSEARRVIGHCNSFAYHIHIACSVGEQEQDRC